MAVPRNKTDLDTELEYGIDIKNRRISFGCPLYTSVHFEDDNSITDFTASSVELAVRAIRRMEKDNPRLPIEIYMNSPGGDPYSMLYLHDIILCSTCQFKFYGGGRIMSSASWIMAVCDERYLYPNATIMVHNGSESQDGTFDDVVLGVNEAKRLMDLLYDVYTANSRMPKNFWKTICSRDLHLNAQETIQLGLADEIVEYKKRGNLRKKRNHLLTEPINKRQLKSLVSKLYSRIGLDILNKEIEIKIPPIDISDPDIVIGPDPEQSVVLESGTKNQKSNPLVNTTLSIPVKNDENNK